MLTPLDIQNYVFKKSVRGYRISEVDDFLDEVIKDFETLYKENMDLKEQIQLLKDGLNRYREMEDTLQKTMVLAQETAEEAKRTAAKEGEIVVWEAQKKAEQIVSNAHQQVLDKVKELEEVKAYEQKVIIQLRGFMRTQLEILEKEDFQLSSLDKINPAKLENKREHTAEDTAESKEEVL